MSRMIGKTTGRMTPLFPELTLPGFRHCSRWLSEPWKIPGGNDAVSSLPDAGKSGRRTVSASEADLIISAIKAGKSKQEAAKIDQMVRLFRSAASGKKR